MNEQERQAAAQSDGREYFAPQERFRTEPSCKGVPSDACGGCWVDRADTERVRYVCTRAQVLPTKTPTAAARTFPSGATRDVDDNKLDYEGFLSPLVLERYAEYMHGKRFIKDLPRRDSDNWQKGMPITVYMKSLWRHFFDVWKEHRGIVTKEGLEDALCAVLFNAMGYLHEHLKAKRGNQG